MTEEELKKAVTELSPDEQTKFGAWFQDFMSARSGETYVPTASEREGVERGLRDAADGKFATDEQVKAVFAKYRDS